MAGGSRRRFGISRVQLGTALLAIALVALQVIAALTWEGWWAIPAVVTLLIGVVLMVIEGRTGDDDGEDGDGDGRGPDDGGGSAGPDTGGGDTVISLNQSGGVTAHTVNMGPPRPTVQLVGETARNEQGNTGPPRDRDLYRTSAEIQIVSARPASGLTVAVRGPVEAVRLSPVGGGVAMCTGGKGPEGAQCTLQTPPPHGRVRVDVLTVAPLEGPVEMSAEAW